MFCAAVSKPMKLSCAFPEKEKNPGPRDWNFGLLNGKNLIFKITYFPLKYLGLGLRSSKHLDILERFYSKLSNINLEILEWKRISRNHPSRVLPIFCFSWLNINTKLVLCIWWALQERRTYCEAKHSLYPPNFGFSQYRCSFRQLLSPSSLVSSGL